MKINELDVVTLKDGRSGTVLDVKQDSKGKAFLVETTEENTNWPYVRESDIASIDWVCKQHD